MTWVWIAFFSVFAGAAYGYVRWEGYTNRDIWNAIVVAIGLGIMAIPTLIGLSGAFVFARQCYEWLRFGIWVPEDVGGAIEKWNIPWPRVKWVGAQKIIDAVLEGVLAMPLSLALLCAGIFIAWVLILAWQAAFPEKPRSAQ